MRGIWNLEFGMWECGVEWSGCRMLVYSFRNCVGLVELKVLGGVFGFLKLSLNSVN